MKKNMFSWWALLYALAMVVYSIFSYSLTAPNLILSNWEPYWDFQLWMWKTLFNNRVLLTHTFVITITLLIASYLLLIRSLKNLKLKYKHLLLLVSIAVIPLFFSNNALSYDVFNYIFNAKMVVVFHANPHEKVALDYAYDDWTRFMHNTHTPAPYGYGWTALSLVPYTLGMGKFLLTWLLFRIWSIVGLTTLGFLLWKFSSSENKWWVLAVMLNPLLLIEAVSNSHNDLWMMVPAVASLLIISRKPTISKSLLSAILLAVSIFIKLATVVLIPVWLLLLLPELKTFTALKKHWAFFASLAMFVLLLTDRSQQFHPWYLIWVLVWVPFVKSTLWKWSIVLLSFSSLFRYIPYLWYGNYTSASLTQEKLITWLPWLVGTLLLGAYHWRTSSK
jgi:hypothetical protein